MARTKTAERREAILAAAKEVFQEMGLDRASMDEIAVRFGGSKATIYRYFDSKEALLKELISRTAHVMGGGMDLLFKSIGMAAQEGQLPNASMQIISLLDPTRDVDSILRELGRQTLKNMHTPQRFAGTRMLVAAAADPEIGRMFYEQGSARAMKFLENYFSNLIERESRSDGQIRPSLPAISAHFSIPKSSNSAFSTSKPRSTMPTSRRWSTARWTCFFGLTNPIRLLDEWSTFPPSMRKRYV